MRQSQIRVRFECRAKTKFFAALNKLLIHFFILFLSHTAFRHANGGDICDDDNYLGQLVTEAKVQGGETAL